MKYSAEFFHTARQRYQLKLNRDAGKPRPWTADPVLRDWRFCNVHREDDRTTAWFREHIRGPISDRVVGAKSRIAVVNAVLAFRWFNRVETGEIIKDLILEKWDSAEARRRLYNTQPVVTGAYIILAHPGMSKLDGVLRCIDDARGLTKHYDTACLSLRGAWEQLRQIPFLGPFMAYEAVSDLRWTPVLQDADDIMTWANAGPGCARGLSRVVHGHKDGFSAGARRDQDKMLELMHELLAMSREHAHWPQQWPAWEMREVEHWACEFDKYQRAAIDGERLKRRYK